MTWHHNAPARRVLTALVSVLLVAACGTSVDTSGDGGESPTSSDETAQTGVSVSDSALGDVLVDPDGWTLYVLTEDEGGESVCYDSCAVDWPPVPADVALGDVDQSLFGSVARTDGPDQLTVAGRPVYLYAGDTTPGDVEGQGVNGVWFVVAPDGSIIKSTQSPDPYDYDY